MADLITVIILVLVIGGAIRYIIKEKKKGAKCIGCPSAGCCPSKKGGESCNCGCSQNQD